MWTALQSLADQEEETDEAAQELHRAKAGLTPATAQAFQVQLLTARRRGEVRRMRWGDVDLDNGWWSIPGAIAKNRRSHRVPRTKPVVEILERRRELVSDGAIFVFENRSGAGSIAYRGKKAASILCRGVSFEVPAHDLRRTAATRMADAGVPRDHIAKVLNLLNASHPDNGGKATFFGGLGFTRAEPGALVEALRGVAVGGDVIARAESQHGLKFVVDGTIRSPSGRQPTVRTVWIIDAGQDSRRLVTAYPGGV